MLVYYFVPFIVSNHYLLSWVSNGHNSITVQNRTHVYMNSFHHKDLGNHLLQSCPKVVKHPVYSIPPDDGLQLCLKHVEDDGQNKQRINSASDWFSLHRHWHVWQLCVTVRLCSNQQISPLSFFCHFISLNMSSVLSKKSDTFDPWSSLSAVFSIFTLVSDVIYSQISGIGNTICSRVLSWRTICTVKQHKSECLYHAWLYSYS